MVRKDRKVAFWKEFDNVNEAGKAASEARIRLDFLTGIYDTPIGVTK